MVNQRGFIMSKFYSTVCVSVVLLVGCSVVPLDKHTNNRHSTPMPSNVQPATQSISVPSIQSTSIIKQKSPVCIKYEVAERECRAKGEIRDVDKKDCIKKYGFSVANKGNYCK